MEPGSTLRGGDTEEVIHERLRAYEQSSLPLSEYYRAKGQLTEIDGDRPLDYVSDGDRAGD